LRLAQAQEAEQAAKLAALREAVAVGIADIEPGRYIEFNDAASLRSYINGISKRVDGVEAPYNFSTVEQLVGDFIAAVGTRKGFVMGRNLKITLEPDWKAAFRTTAQRAKAARCGPTCRVMWQGHLRHGGPLCRFWQRNSFTRVRIHPVVGPRT